MPPTFVDSGALLSASALPARKRSRWVRVLAAALALTVASTSAGLLVRVGQLESADQAMLEALRQPGLEHLGCFRDGSLRPSSSERAAKGDASERESAGLGNVSCALGNALDIGREDGLIRKGRQLAA